MRAPSTRLDARPVCTSGHDASYGTDASSRTAFEGFVRGSDEPTPGEPHGPPARPCAPHIIELIYNHMVARNELTDAEVDRLFRALADATRRDIVARVLAGESASVSALAARYDMSFAAVQKHVAVLEGAGLVTKQPRGRERIVRGNPRRIARAREVLSRLERLWRDRFSQLDAVLDEPSTEE